MVVIVHKRYVQGKYVKIRLSESIKDNDHLFGFPHERSRVIVSTLVGPTRCHFIIFRALSHNTKNKTNIFGSIHSSFWFDTQDLTALSLVSNNKGQQQPLILKDVSTVILKFFHTFFLHIKQAKNTKKR